MILGGPTAGKAQKDLIEEIVRTLEGVGRGLMPGPTGDAAREFLGWLFREEYEPFSDPRTGTQVPMSRGMVPLTPSDLAMAGALKNFVFKKPKKVWGGKETLAHRTLNAPGAILKEKPGGPFNRERYRLPRETLAVPEDVTIPSEQLLRMTKAVSRSALPEVRDVALAIERELSTVPARKLGLTYPKLQKIADSLVSPTLVKYDRELQINRLREALDEILSQGKIDAIVTPEPGGGLRYRITNPEVLSNPRQPRKTYDIRKLGDWTLSFEPKEPGGRHVPIGFGQTMDLIHATREPTLLNRPRSLVFGTRRKPAFHLGTPQAGIERLEAVGPGTPAWGFKEARMGLVPYRLRFKRTLGTIDHPVSDNFQTVIMETPGYRQQLLKDGFDGIIYRNSVEDPGSISVIALKPDPVIPKKAMRIADYPGTRPAVQTALNKAATEAKIAAAKSFATKALEAQWGNLQYIENETGLILTNIAHQPSSKVAKEIWGLKGFVEEIKKPGMTAEDYYKAIPSHLAKKYLVMPY